MSLMNASPFDPVLTVTGLVAYEMALLVERVGGVLTPQVRGAQSPR